MENVVSLPVAAAVCLFGAQSLLVLIRTRSCLRPSVPLLLSGFLLAMTARLLRFGGSSLQEVLLVVIIWAAGAFLIRAGNRRMFGQWASGCLALLLTLLLARALGPEDAAPYVAFRSFGIALLAAVPLGLLFRAWRSRSAVQALATFVACCLWLLVGAAGAIGPVPVVRMLAGGDRLGGIPELLLSLCCGWLVFQEGYPERTSWNGSLQGLTARVALAPSLYARFLETEAALAWQERVTTAGFLALGAAHEFKNVLSHVRLASQHGLSQPDPQRKDECLRLIAEAVGAGQDSALAVLGRLASGEGGETCGIDAARDLPASLRRAGSVLRGEGIVIQLELEAGVVFRARLFDVEQIVLSLVHNAAEGYRRHPGDDTRFITVLARTEEEWAVIEVRDEAGGVDVAVRDRLFAPAASATGSSGLGLYLSRNLALANGGSLDYEPLAGGSVFRLSLPLAE
jgi:signal transduction histidine kinase